MAHAFNPMSTKPVIGTNNQNISGKSTFGTLKPNLYQSDYINRKKGIITFCKSPAKCQRMKSAPNYNTLYSFGLGRYSLTLDRCNIFPVNKSNLIFSQYSKLNLKDVCTVSQIEPGVNPEPCGDVLPCNPCQNNNPVIINPATAINPFYWTYQIDPLGELFGKTQCGELNYTHYMVLNPPTNPLTFANS